MKVEVAERVDEEYGGFVDSFASSVCQHTLGWKQVLEGVSPLKTEAFYLKAKQHGEVIGVLPSFIYFGELGPVMVSLSFPGAYGGVVSKEKEAYKALLREWVASAKARGCLSATVVSYPFSNDEKLYKEYFNPTHGGNCERVSGAGGIFGRT